MREPDQRFWDALIIREWYRFGNAKDLQRLCKVEFGCWPNELPLHRVESCFGGVRSWVATFMPSLSHKLLTTPKENSIDVLNWLGKTKVRCETPSKNISRYHKEATHSARTSDIRLQQYELSRSLEKLLNRENQPNIVKSTSARRYSR